MIARYIIVVFLTSFSCISIFAQDLVKPGIHSKGLNIHNPASETIKDDRYQSIDVYGKQKFIDNPAWNKDMNIMLSYAARVGRESGFWTVSYLYDNYSYYNRHILSLGYGKGWSLSEKKYLSVGIRGVLNSNDVKWQKLYNYQGHNMRQSLYMMPDMDMGVEYCFGKIRTGISLRNIFATTRYLHKEGVILYDRRMLFYDIEYKHLLAKDFKIGYHISAYLERDIIADVGFLVEYKEKYNFIYNFRLLETRHIGGFMVNFEKINLGVVYDISHLHIDHNIEFVVGVKL